MTKSKILNSSCPLCILEKKTLWLEKYFGEFWRIIICDSCHVPMVVFKYHSFPTEEEKKKMIQALKKAAQAFFGDDNFYIDMVQRKIKNHWHVHARKGKQ